METLLRITIKEKNQFVFFSFVFLIFIFHFIFHEGGSQLAQQSQPPSSLHVAASPAGNKATKLEGKRFCLNISFNFFVHSFSGSLRIDSVYSPHSSGNGGNGSSPQ
jgi:hypothetical protein